jgi:cell division protein FtsW
MVAGGAVAATAFIVTPYQRLKRYAPVMYGAGVVLLLMVWMPGIGHAAKGAQRWFGIGGFHFQPAEAVKLIVLISLATWLDRNRGRLHDVQNVLLPAGAIVGVPLLLIIIQPDFGSTMIIAGLCGVMLFLAGLRWSWVLTGVSGGAFVGALVLMAESYRIRRVTSFLDPLADCAGDGYQVCQSLLALHRGGLAGQGLGGSLAKMSYLPEPQNDFIAAIIGEELGLWGMMLLMSLYALLAWRGFKIASEARDLFGSLLAGTLTVMLVGQACLNLGVVMSIVPPKGLVLPFLSYGPSAMLVNLAAVGLLMSISAGTRAVEQKESEAKAAGMALA